jgi:ribonucleoside-diphosphate reductase alpha chain
MRTYSYDHVRSASINYFKGDELAADVFSGKYALQDLEGNLYEQTPTDMHRRLAREFARIEANYPNPLSEDEIYEMLSDWQVVPQGGPMSAIGNKFQVQSLSNCFVIESPYDSYGGIMKADQEQVQIMKRRGGVGFDISTIRPKGLAAANAARTTDGSGIFMERYSNSCREVAQEGRRGALMLTISVHHPDVLTFANIKRDRKKVTGANVSVRMTNEFMQAVKDNKEYEQRFPVDKDVKHIVSKMVNAREVWQNIVKAMRDCSEPGMLFWDQVIDRSPADAYAKFGFKTSSTNPCGELPLPPADSCRLLLINLSKFVIDPFTTSARFDYQRYGNVVQKAQKLMDDLVDLELEAINKIINKIEHDPEPEDIKTVELNLWKKIKKVAIDGRRTGLGITALGDTFAYLNLQYGSNDSIKLTEEVYKALALNSYRSSVMMARDRGPFPIFSLEVEKNHVFIEQIMSEDRELRMMYEKHGRRNIANTTTAPAGSTSLLTQTTSGCEPVLFLKARRKRKVNPSDKQARVDEVDKSGDKWQHYDISHHGVAKWSEVTGEHDESKSPYFGSTVESIDWLKKIDIQAAAQKWLCHSVSNTTNLPEDVTTETVEKLCMHAWETGCKGVTIYRIGSRDAVIVKESDSRGQPIMIVETHAPKRPRELPCDIQRATVQGETYLVLIGLLNGHPYEIFAGLQEHVEVPRKAKEGTLIKNGKNKDGIATYNLKIPIGDDDVLLFKDIVNLFDSPVYGAFTRTISLALRHGVPVQYLCEQLKKDKHSDITSFSNVIARVLSKSYIPDGTKVTTEKTCAQCGSTNVYYQQGCSTCGDCGASKCG